MVKLCIYSFILILGVCLCMSCIPYSGRSDELPNIVLIMTDDMGYGDIGCYNDQSKIPKGSVFMDIAEGAR
jgi:arylsulfatase A